MRGYKIKNGVGIIPKGTVHIPNSAFLEREDLVSIEIPESVKEIGANAFFGCTNLKDITIPDDVDKLEYRDQRGVFSITEHRPFPGLLDAVVNRGLIVYLHKKNEITDDWYFWN